jgi:hypothetical protein
MNALKSNGLIKYKPGKYNNYARIDICNISDLKDCTGNNSIPNLKPYVFVYEIFLHFEITKK